MEINYDFFENNEVSSYHLICADYKTHKLLEMTMLISISSQQKLLLNIINENCNIDFYKTADIPNNAINEIISKPEKHYMANPFIKNEIQKAVLNFEQIHKLTILNSGYNYGSDINYAIFNKTNQKMIIASKGITFLNSSFIFASLDEEVEERIEYIKNFNSAATIIIATKDGYILSDVTFEQNKIKSLFSFNVYFTLRINNDNEYDIDFYNYIYNHIKSAKNDQNLYNVLSIFLKKADRKIKLFDENFQTGDD